MLPHVDNKLSTTVQQVFHIICDLILENRRYLHNFQNVFICFLFSTGTEEWTS